jgi:hypothetical protein
VKTIVYDHQTFALQQYGGISRYFCELASRVDSSECFRSRVVAPLHFNHYLAESASRHISMLIPLRHPRMAHLHRFANHLLAPILIEAARPALVHKTYYGASSLRLRVSHVVTVFDMIHELF